MEKLTRSRASEYCFDKGDMFLYMTKKSFNTFQKVCSGENSIKIIPGKHHFGISLGSLRQLSYKRDDPSECSSDGSKYYLYDIFVKGKGGIAYWSSDNVVIIPITVYSNKLGDDIPIDLDYLRNHTTKGETFSIILGGNHDFFKRTTHGFTFCNRYMGMLKNQTKADVVDMVPICDGCNPLGLIRASEMAKVINGVVVDYALSQQKQTIQGKAELFKNDSSKQEIVLPGPARYS